MLDKVMYYNGTNWALRTSATGSGGSGSGVTLMDTVPYDTVTLTTSANAEQLPSQATTNGVIISAPITNDVVINVGFDGTVSATKNLYTLTPGSSTELLYVTNLDIIWVVATWAALEDHDVSYAVF